MKEIMLLSFSLGLIAAMAGCMMAPGEGDDSREQTLRILTDEELRADTIEDVREVIDNGQLFGGARYTEDAYMGGNGFRIPAISWRQSVMRG